MLADESVYQTPAVWELIFYQESMFYSPDISNVSVHLQHLYHKEGSW